MRALLATVLAISAAGCAVFDGPPEVTIVGDQQGQLMDPHAPLVLSFSKEPKPETLKFEVARYVTDSEGNLADEQNPPGFLDLLFSHDPTSKPPDTDGTSALAADDLSMTVTYDVPPPAATPLVLLIEPGFEDKAGAVTVARRRIVFTYTSSLTCNAPAHVLQQGTYFFIVSVTKPVMTHVNLYAVVQVDPATGELKTRFTKAKRNPDPNRCPTPCASGQVCRLLPMPACVAPSEPPGSTDEYSDYVPDPDLPTGFGFSTTGCTADQSGGAATFVTAPVDIVVSSPMVTLRNGALNSSFAPDMNGVLRGTGSLVADAVLLGTINSGMGQGDLTARLIPDADVPKGLPQP
jgi:hypothetical protein